MTDSIERELREAMDDKAATYPVNPHAWARVQAKTARRGRRRALAVPAAVATVVGGGAVAAAVIPGQMAENRPGLVGSSHPSPGEGIATGDARTVMRECLRQAGETPSRIVQSAGGAPWIAAMHRGGKVLFLHQYPERQRAACRFLSEPTRVPFSHRLAFEYTGEKGWSSVDWRGTADVRAVRFEARFTDGARMTFSCQRMWLCDKTISPDGKSMVFATTPVLHRPKTPPGTRVSGEFSAYDKDGRLLGSAPFSTR